MKTVNLNRPITYLSSSQRYFAPHEHHIQRFCNQSVLLLVYQGVLRFSENGVEYELYPGQYHIQQQNSWQNGLRESDTPSYFYVHFLADWGQEDGLPQDGFFSYGECKPAIDRLERLVFQEATQMEKTAAFLDILCLLLQKPTAPLSVAEKIGGYLQEHYARDISLDDLCREFHFSKNHIIHLFAERYGKTPFVYLRQERIKNAKRLLVASSDTAEAIAFQCGFQNYSRFYRVFKDAEGVSPQEWRIRSRLQSPHRSDK